MKEVKPTLDWATGMPRTVRLLQLFVYMTPRKVTWFLLPLTLHYVAGDTLHFLSYLLEDYVGQVGTGKIGATIRIRGQEKRGVLTSAKFQTLGAISFGNDCAVGCSDYEVGSGGVGEAKINGNLVSPSKVPESLRNLFP